jgi:hypothetical protein
METTVAIAFAVLITGWLVRMGIAARAEGESRSLLDAWGWDHHMTVLRCRRCWWATCCGVIPFDHPLRIYYNISAIDSEGRMTLGRVSVTGKLWQWKFYPSTVHVEWIRVRAIASVRNRRLRAQPRRGPLWDPWIDG